MMNVDEVGQKFKKVKTALERWENGIVDVVSDEVKLEEVSP